MYKLKTFSTLLTLQRDVGRLLQTIDRSTLIHDLKTQQKYIARRESLIQSRFNDSFINSQKGIYQGITGEYKITGYDFNDMNTETLKDLYMQNEKFLNSSLSTIKGRTDVFNRQFASFKNNYNIANNWTKKDFLIYQKLIGSSRLQERIARGELDSSQIMEYIATVSRGRGRNIEGLPDFSRFKNMFTINEINKFSEDDVDDLISLINSHPEYSRGQIRDAVL